MDEIYLDQSTYRTNFGEWSFSNTYTPYGIQCIDTQYCMLIRNLHLKVKVYGIERKRVEYTNIKTRVVSKGSHCHSFYTPVDLDKGSFGYGVRVVWENGHQHDFHYGPRPVFNPKTSKINTKKLIKDITNNPHLHQVIKDNLLDNLKNYMIYAKD